MPPPESTIGELHITPKMGNWHHPGHHASLQFHKNNSYDISIYSTFIAKGEKEETLVGERRANPRSIGDEPGVKIDQWEARGGCCPNTSLTLTQLSAEWTVGVCMVTPGANHSPHWSAKRLGGQRSPWTDPPGRPSNC